MGIAKEELSHAIPILNQNSRAKEMIGVLPKVIQFSLEGEEKAFSLVVEGDQLILDDTAKGNPEIIVSGDAGEVAKIFSREREITHPVAEGKVWISKGKLSQMIILDRVLNFRRKK